MATCISKIIYRCTSYRLAGSRLYTISNFFNGVDDAEPEERGVHL
jgi:hypothetical protein